MLIASALELGDIAIIEGWPLAEMMQAFPNSPVSQWDWSRKVQLFSLFDINGKHSVTCRAYLSPMPPADTLIVP